MLPTELRSDRAELARSHDVRLSRLPVGLEDEYKLVRELLAARVSAGLTQAGPARNGPSGPEESLAYVSVIRWIHAGMNTGTW